MNDKVVVGQIISAHGIQGQFKIKSFTTDPDDLFTFNKLFIDEKYDEIFLKKIRSLNEYFIVSCSEIDSRNKVDDILNKNILISRSQLPDIGDEFYFNDLIGLSVISNEEIIGPVISVNNFGSSDLLEVKTLSNDKKYFIPFNDKTIEQVDQKKKIIYLKNISQYLE
tara:strand:- start:569 stop:1069 length:501 start_codon:yes stop_codon:yes gene_type:complete